MIRVRVIDDTNGHPLPKQQVSISLLYEKGEKVPANYDALLQLETDVNGEVQFRLPEPAPAHLAAQVRLTSEHWHCGCTALVDTQDLIQKGLVGPEPGHGSTRSTASVKAEPGEILFVARPFTFFERLLYPLVKG
jgi:hypothetical protein